MVRPLTSNCLYIIWIQAPQILTTEAKTPVGQQRNLSMTSQNKFESFNDWQFLTKKSPVIGGGRWLTGDDSARKADNPITDYEFIIIVITHSTTDWFTQMRMMFMLRIWFNLEIPFCLYKKNPLLVGDTNKGILSHRQS